MRKKSLRGSLLLLLASMIWGASFVAQSVGVTYVGPFTLNGTRLILGGVFLLICIPVLDKMRGIQNGWKHADKNLWWGGILCGIALFCASNLQQVGLMTTSAGKAGFITTLYVVLVPLCGLFIGKKPGIWAGISVVVAAIGLYMLCIKGTVSLEKGDLLVLWSAVGYTGHILIIDYFSPKVDGVRLSCLQFFTAGILSLFCMAATETPTWQGLQAAAIPILYAGILSGGVGYTLQILAQKDTNPTVSALIMCLESVFAVLFAWLLQSERLTAQEGIGCALIFIAIVLAQSGDAIQKIFLREKGYEKTK